MKQSILIVLGGVLATLITIPQTTAFLACNAQTENSNMRQNDEIRKTFKLTPGARIEISNIRGPVAIETSNTDSAEILITRSAESRDVLQQDKIDIDNSSGGLIIRGAELARNAGGNTPDVRHNAKLKLPRRADLTIKGIGGELQIGDLDGQLDVTAVGGAVKGGAVSGIAQVSAVGGPVTLGNVGKNASIKSIGGAVTLGEVNGPVSISGVNGGATLGAVAQGVEVKNVSGEIKIAQVNESLDISGVNGGLTTSISKLGSRGVQISNVSGAIELRFKGEPGAQFSTQNVPGKVSIDLPNVTIEDKTASAMRARIGKGGPPISINGVNGSVHLALDTQTVR